AGVWTGFLGEFVLPAGISFYTFHQAVFLADAYEREENVVEYVGQFRSVAEVLRALLRYSAFVAFFPQLVIGPINYLKEFNPQVGKNFGRITYLNVAIGLAFISIGLAKKVLIADSLARIADPVFDAASFHRQINPLAAYIAILCYYFQLYFDFSGYSEMAL